MVRRSRSSLEEIITHIEALSQGIEEIAFVSTEQATGIDELNRAISQIDSTTQQNATTVEELAGTSDSLSVEAGELARHVARFKVGDDVEHEQKLDKPKRVSSVRSEPQNIKEPAIRSKASLDASNDGFEEF